MYICMHKCIYRGIHCNMRRLDPNVCGSEPDPDILAIDTHDQKKTSEISLEVLN